MRRLATIARTPFTRRAWGEVAYCLVSFPLALAGFVVVLFLLALGTGLTLSLIGAVLGLLLVVAATLLSRGLGALQRGLAAGLLRERVPAPPASRPGSGALGRLDAKLRDATGWRATAYVLVRLPVAAAGLYAVGWWYTALFNLTTGVRWVLGQDLGRAGEGVPLATPLPVGGRPNITTFAGTFGAAAVGAAILLVAPWLTRGVVAADRWLIRSLLGPGALAERVRDLEQSRARAVDDSAALLRRVERDLHDGAQVRLVAVAMSLDMARERLDVDGESGSDPRVRQLLDGAHRNATEALTELRDLARGLHPPALDDGLPDALATLAGRSTVPVELVVELPAARPTAAIETIAYFCAAELLTNVIKHSGARRAGIAVGERGGRLCLRVTDNGRGGAAAGTGSGLAGLAERVRTVDGTLVISSPDGGPTEVTVDLPWHA